MGENKLPQISPSTNLKKHIRDVVSSAYENARVGLGNDEYAYVRKRIHAKLRSLEASGTAWVRDMGRHGAALYALYIDYARGNLELTLLVAEASVAALFYLVNPYDVIPDHVPGDGYLDDAHVMNLAVRIVESQHPGLFQKYLNQIDTGL